MYRTIFIDQCGYLPSDQKLVTFRSDTPVNFQVLKSDGTPVFEAVADRKFQNISAGENNMVGNFSPVTTPGIYYIVTADLRESESFPIMKKVYQDVFQKSMAFFYLQSCGRSLSAEAAGIYSHCACHTKKAEIYGNTKLKLDVSGGWHDAGDYGRYIVPGAMAVAQLLFAWERNPELCSSYHCPDISLRSTLPDFLAEVRVELDWMCKLQREDGAVYHKATCYQFCKFIMPDDETDPMVLSPVSVTATADFAAVCALAYRIYQPYDPEYAQRLATVSKKAYACLKTLNLPGGFKNPPEISTGEYSDTCDLDERYWAAAELYRSFGIEDYRKDFETLAKQKIYEGYGWADMGSYGNLAYLSTTFPTDPALTAAIQDTIINRGKELLSLVKADGYGTSLRTTEYIWGSNMNVANNGLHLYDAYCITGDHQYLDAVSQQLHYLLGRNPMGLCYLTGCGTNAIKHPHHRPSGFLGKAMPGMLSGGPCNYLADDVAKHVLSHQTPPAKAMVDMTGSYSTNEVTIYWNSAFIALLALFPTQ